jgi:GH15 family glucan-1,4-alpha-glucosidase
MSDPRVFVCNSLAAKAQSVAEIEAKLATRGVAAQEAAAAIERELMSDGFVRRYSTTEDVDGLPPGEGAFLACTFWLADNYAAVGRLDEAVTLFERLLDLRNDVGLLAEEYDPVHRRMTGNFPQAFSHVPLIYVARNLSRALAGRSEAGRYSTASASAPA